MTSELFEGVKVIFPIMFVVLSKLMIVEPPPVDFDAGGAAAGDFVGVESAKLADLVIVAASKRITIVPGRLEFSFWDLMVSVFFVLLIFNL